MAEIDPLAENGIDLRQIFLDLVERTGMTKYRIAQQTGINETLLSHYTTGRRRPTLDALCTIAPLAGLRVTVELQRASGPRSRAR